MKIALIHYHLKTGGVATVLKNQIAALQPVCDLLVLTGGRHAAALPCPIEEIAGLGYDRPGEPPIPPDRTVACLLAAVHRRWPDGCDIVHIHNPLLAKNRQFLKIIEGLHQAGINLFLQIHDFAEEGRPDRYFVEDYPADCHYGVLNHRDADRLAAAGLDRRGVHLLPNAVQCLPVLSDRRPRSHVLYPVRAIRRKNLGEAILLSLFLGPDRRVLVTQPPNSPADKASYRDWTAWVRRKRLPVDFEAGLEKDFLSLLKGADSVISTSVAEGFGLAFLEPWIAGRPMWGRRLDAICRDFEARGMRLDFLYDRLDVPTGWIDAERFARRWHQAVRRAAEGYRHVLSDTNAEKAYRRMTHGGRIDFGMLEEGFQRQVLTRLTGDRFARRALIRLNPWLENPGEIPNASTVIENNRRAAVQHYDSGGYRRRLLAIYRRVIDHPVRHRIDKKVLLAACFDLDRFSLLQWGAYAGE